MSAMDEQKAEKRKFPRQAALDVTRQLTLVLGPLSARYKVCGSLRRRRELVGDIEIVYIPHWMQWPDAGDIFGREIPVNVFDHALNLALESGVLAKRRNKLGRESWGDENKLAVHCATGIPIDFFATTQEAWWNYVVCRTGGAESNIAICTAAQELGWKWHPTGAGFERMEGAEKGTIRAVRCERDVFDFVGLPYLEPSDRK